MRPIPRRAFLAGKDEELTALLALPTDRRRLVLSNSRRAFPLVEALVGHCFALRFHDMAGMLETGQLAAEAAGALTALQTGRSERELHDLRAHAWAVRGNALRIAGAGRAASRALFAAEKNLRRGTGQRRDLSALLLEFSASLCGRQHEYGEAQELLARALQLRVELADRKGTGKVLIQQGITFGYAGDPERAVVTLAEALGLVGDDQDLARAAFQGLIWHLIEAQRAERARDILDQARALLAGGGGLFRRKLQRLEAKLARSLDPEPAFVALRLFDRVLRG
jgi:tetratricopeptide (TPR) repeat protein